MKINWFKISFVFLFIMLFMPSSVFGYSIGTKTDFYTEAGLSKDDKKEITATLISSPDNLHLYIETSFWESKDEETKKEIRESLDALSKEFNEVIYPQLTSVFGNEQAIGANRDARTTIIFHEMKSNVNGYIRNIDAYERNINPFSNQRKLIYISSDLILGEYLKETLAHEFVHLITLNNKDLEYGIAEDKWLNEARAEYAVTLLGYNQNGGYISRRISSFLEKPYTSLTEWEGSAYNYGVINSFIHYLVDHYGVEILVNSLKSNTKGIESIDNALSRSGSKDRFSDILINWAIAVQVNDCAVGEKYCFKDKNFKNVYIMPFSNFLPFSGESTLYTGQTLKNHSAHWQRFAGGKGELKIKFSNPSGVIMKVPYIIKSVSGKTDIGFIDVDRQEAELIISGFGKDISYIIIIPVAINNNAQISNGESYFYSITTQTFSKEVQENGNNDIELPFEVDKPLNQMNREELLMVIIRLIIYLLMQGKLVI